MIVFIKIRSFLVKRPIYNIRIISLAKLPND